MERLARAQPGARPEYTELTLSVLAKGVLCAFADMRCILAAAVVCPSPGNAAGVVLWDVRTQEAVGSIPAGGSGSRFAAGSPSKRGSSSKSLSCVGVQLDDWRLVTGFAAHGSSGGGCGSSGGGANAGGSNACWWHSGGEAWGEESSWGGWGPGHSLEVYDIRAAASFSTAAASASKSGDGAASSSSSSSGCSSGLWTAAPVLSLPVPNRITCFQVRMRAVLACEMLGGDVIVVLRRWCVTVGSTAECAQSSLQRFRAL